MSENQHPDPALERYLAAYREAEPRRRRSPFADPRLAVIAADRAARHASPWRRLLATSPLAPLAPAMLALALTLAPAPAITPLAAPMTTETAPVVASTPLAGAAADSLDTREGTPAPLPVDPWRIAALAVAIAGLSIAMRRARRRA